MAPSQDAVVRATGEEWDHWFAVLDGLPGDDHTTRVRALAAAHPELDAWWQQSIVVEWEKARGHRVEGQSCAGDFQVSCSRTLPGDPDKAWARLMDHGILPTADWTPGATWQADGVDVEVRRVDPAKMLRWWWHDADGRSTVEVSFVPKGDKTSVVFRHHQLASQAAREQARSRWKQVLAVL